MFHIFGRTPQKATKKQNEALYNKLFTDFKDLSRRKGHSVHNDLALPGPPKDSLQYDIPEDEVPPSLQNSGILTLTVSLEAPIVGQTAPDWPETVSITLIRDDNTNPVFSFTRSAHGTVAAEAFMAGQSDASLDMEDLSDEVRGRIIREILESTTITYVGLEAKYADQVRDFFKTRKLSTSDMALLQLILAAVTSANK